MNKLHRWNWLVLSVALVALPFTTPTQAVGVSASQGYYAPQSYAPLSQAELEQMLAPIALYPDSLLSHILIASTYPFEVVQAQRWLENHPKLSVDQVMSRTENKGWDPSVNALMAFPTVLQKMTEDLDWTQKLGEAFLADEAQVMDGIQSLRQQADKANSLAKMENMAITRANKQIIIEPVRREVVYVPYYDTRIVYGTWRWGVAYPPVYWQFGGKLGGGYFSGSYSSSGYSSSSYLGRPYRPNHSYFYWSPGIHISFNYFFSSFHWHRHKVVVINHHHSHFYRPRERYSVSHGAQPWKHKPEHRRGVAYHNPVAKQRYYTDSKYRGRDSHSSGSGQHVSSQYAKSREHQDARYQPDIKGNDKRHDKDRGSNLSHERTPNLQHTQAELKARRTAQMNSAAAAEGNDSKERYSQGHSKERGHNNRHDNPVRHSQAKTTREQTKDNSQPKDNSQRHQRQYQSQSQAHTQTQAQQPRHLVSRVPPQGQENRAEIKRTQAQRMEQHRQGAPRQREN